MISRSFFKSVSDYENALHTTEYAYEWLRARSRKVDVSIKPIPFAALQNWSFSKDGSLRHDSGKFFSIDGICVETNYGFVNTWQQPIINQPEVGYLGIITKEINGVLHFLMQAKIEPGNINCVQLSPTLQATRSNYSRVHQGKAPAYLEYFQAATREQILCDQLQSEQGARFLKKRNRNIILKIDADIPVYENFIWLTLAQLKEMMRRDNVVNMDTRTVLSAISFCHCDDTAQAISLEWKENISPLSRDLLASWSSDSWSVHTLDDIILFITDFKCRYDLNVVKIPLSDMEHWTVGEESIYHKQRRYFEIIAAEILIENREVSRWTQPMVKPAQDGLCAFIVKKINGVLHFAVQAKLECGNFDIMELAPTVQCLTGSYVNEGSRRTLPFLQYVLDAKEDQIFYDTYQSEEGGRFFKEQNRNMLILAGDEIPDALPPNYIWMTLNQLQSFMKYNNYANIQTRNLIAAIPLD